MSTLDNIIKLMDEKHITGYMLCTELGLSKSALTEWKKGRAKPSMDAIIKIADYFNVSVDSLLGRDEPTQTPTTTNTVKAIARGGEVVEFEYTDEEMQTILKMLELTKKI